MRLRLEFSSIFYLYNRSLNIIQQISRCERTFIEHGQTDETNNFYISNYQT